MGNHTRTLSILFFPPIKMIYRIYFIFIESGVGVYLTFSASKPFFRREPFTKPIKYGYVINIDGSYSYLYYLEFSGTIISFYLAGRRRRIRKTRA